MPSFGAILTRAMMFNTSVKVPKLLAAGDPVAAPPPPVGNPTAPEDVIKKTPVWSWSHDPDKPNRVADIGSRVRGMGMNYNMVMPVCTEITLDEVSLTTKAGVDVLLPLDKSYVIRKAYLASGSMPARTSGLWQLEAELDQSILVAFGYSVLTDGSTKPLTQNEIEVLGDSLFPNEGEKPAATAVVDQKTTLLISPLRVVVTFSITCCMERPDWEPGAVLGANRIYPHVMVTCSDDVKAVGAVVTVQRPAKTAHPGPMPSTAQYPDEMLPDLGPILVTDSNNPIYTFPGAPVLPLWDRMFDYYDLEPLTSGTGSAAMVMVDPARKNKRTLAGALRKSFPPPTPPATHNVVDLLKLPRQGAFDNVHLAPKMKIAPKAYVNAPGMQTERVSMAPFCVHDCLHMHFRWGLADPQKFNRGFDDNYNPYSTDGATLVPHDQRVSLKLVAPAGFIYDASVSATVPAGRTTTFFHHGMAYSNEVWAPNTVTIAQGAVDVMCQGRGEHVFPGTLSSTNSWAVFYWHLRWGGKQNMPIERLQVPNLAAAMAL